jgi:hypothetical protein
LLRPSRDWWVNVGFGMRRRFHPAVNSEFRDFIAAARL